MSGRPARTTSMRPAGHTSAALAGVLAALGIAACSDDPEVRVHEPSYSPGQRRVGGFVDPSEPVAPDLPCLPASDPRLADLLSNACMASWHVVAGPFEGSTWQGPTCSYSARYTAIENCSANTGRPLLVGGVGTVVAALRRDAAWSTG